MPVPRTTFVSPHRSFSGLTTLDFQAQDFSTTAQQFILIFATPKKDIALFRVLVIGPEFGSQISYCEHASLMLCLCLCLYSVLVCRPPTTTHGIQHRTNITQHDALKHENNGTGVLSCQHQCFMITKAVPPSQPLANASLSFVT